MEKEDIAYIAGFFDGEGTITLTKESKYRYPTISISNTALNILEYIKALFGGCISNQKRYKDHHKLSYSWKITHNNSLKFVKAVLPYIKDPEKVRRCKLVNTKYLQVTRRNGKYSEEEHLQKLAFEQEFFHPSNALVKDLP